MEETEKDKEKMTAKFERKDNNTFTFFKTCFVLF